MPISKPVKPTRRERAAYYQEAWDAATQFLDIQAMSRERGERRSRQKPYSKTTYDRFSKLMLIYLELRYISLPAVTIQLEQITVRGDIIAGREQIDLATLNKGVGAFAISDVMTIIATGTERPVTAQFGSEIVTATVNTNPRDFEDNIRFTLGKIARGGA